MNGSAPSNFRSLYHCQPNDLFSTRLSALVSSSRFGKLSRDAFLRSAVKDRAKLRPAGLCLGNEEDEFLRLGWF